MLHTYLSNNDLENAEILTFKIIHSDYIERTKSTGDIYLGCADFYSDKARTGKIGQGDPEEGLYARVLKNNQKYIQEQERLHRGNLVKDENGDFFDLKLKSVINMPVYCFYSIHASDSDVKYFDEAGETSNIRYRTYQFNIPQRVFEDFSDSNFSIMKFLNHTDLSSRVEKSLKAAGIVDIRKSRIKYVDRAQKEWFCPEQHPFELFYKDNFFKHQKEGRIIIGDSKLSFINKRLSNQKCGPLNIGNVKDIIENNPIKVQDIKIVIPRIRIEEI